MRQDVLSTNFSGGEISPRLYGRPDLAKYADSVKEARDVVVMQHGGVRGAPKFPSSLPVRLLLRIHRRTDRKSVV